MMKWLLTVFALSTSLGCQAYVQRDTSTTCDFDKIEPSVNLTWTPCFSGAACSRLKVPLDYANKSLGSTAIAFAKVAGKNATVESPSIVIIPGGPGGSGVDLLLSNSAILGTMFGEKYNFVSFDPRGVNHSGLALDCFSGNKKARLAFANLHSTGATNISSASLTDQYYSSSIYGDWCNAAVESNSPHGYYVTTPAVAQDLLTFVEAEAAIKGQAPSEAKLWSYGISYGTVIGSTFASMFPERVGRMVLDGILNAQQYYDNDWRDNLDQTDKAMEMFATLCHSAGHDKCSFWSSTPNKIISRLDSLIDRLQSHPIPLSGARDGDVPTMVTYSDLKTRFLNAVYNPIAEYPSMADDLHQLEGGNASALAGAFEDNIFKTDARLVIQCTDGNKRNKLNTIEDFSAYVNYTSSKSKYIGDIYPIFLETILCRSFQPELPDSLVFKGPVGAIDKPTFFPILFASNTIDPITPLTSARKMSSLFSGSKLLLQEAIGHTVVNQGASECYFKNVQAYYSGVLPASNTTCPQQYTPFIDDSPMGSLS